MLNAKGFDYFTTTQGIIDLSIACVLVALIVFLSIKFKFGKISVIVLAALLLLIFGAEMCEFIIIPDILVILTIGVMFVLCLSHIGSIRTSLANLKRHDFINRKSGVNKLIDREALYKEIYEAVSACSRQKIGALITFEKHDDLSNLTKNGTVINAPVTHELLMTIFYPGTRLHDGAVIIKNNIIYAASVYYTPTTKALAGKYGSRHRAAIGISQQTDSVTVVVSEETGRVSIAQGGEIDPVTLDDFVNVLTERINQGE